MLKKLQIPWNNSVRVTLDKGEVRAEGIFDNIENGKDVHAEISRRDQGEWLDKVPDLEHEESDRDWSSEMAIH